ADGGKQTNLDSNVPIAPKVWGDGLWIDEESPTTGQLNKWLTGDGYYTYDGGNYGVQWDIISDPLTARRAKIMKLWELTGSVASYTNNGALDYDAADRAVTCSDKTGVAAVNGSVSINVLGDAAGGNGATYELDAEDYQDAHFGVVTLNDPSPGWITYTPIRRYEGTDEAFVFVKSANRFDTVRLDFLVGTDGAVTAPENPANFGASNSASVTGIAVTLGDPPDAGGREIKLVQYSTDGGSTWARLCHKWRKSVYHIDTGSDGTSLGAGVQTMRLRYQTDYDRAFSDASGSETVVVT
ncbi:MAG: hypothetical protein AAGG72_05440, partial [Pseudomonadota bacterium]